MNSDHTYTVVRGGQGILSTNSHRDAKRYAKRLDATIRCNDDTPPAPLKNLGDGVYAHKSGEWIAERTESYYEEGLVWWNVKKLDRDGNCIDIWGETELLLEARRLITRLIAARTPTYEWTDITSDVVGATTMSFPFGMRAQVQRVLTGTLFHQWRRDVLRITVWKPTEAGGWEREPFDTQDLDYKVTGWDEARTRAEGMAARAAWPVQDVEVTA